MEKWPFILACFKIINLFYFWVLLYITILLKEWIYKVNIGHYLILHSKILLIEVPLFKFLSIMYCDVSI